MNPLKLCGPSGPEIPEKWAPPDVYIWSSFKLGVAPISRPYYQKFRSCIIHLKLPSCQCDSLFLCISVVACVISTFSLNFRRCSALIVKRQTIADSECARCYFLSGQQTWHRGNCECKKEAVYSSEVVILRSYFNESYIRRQQEMVRHKRSKIWNMKLKKC
jgi:hypothetical protein